MGLTLPIPPRQGAPGGYGLSQTCQAQISPVSGKGFLPCDPPMLTPLRAQAQARHLGQPMVALILAAHMTMSRHMVECDYQGV